MTYKQRFITIVFILLVSIIISMKAKWDERNPNNDFMTAVTIYCDWYVMTGTDYLCDQLISYDQTVELSKTLTGDELIRNQTYEKEQKKFVQDYYIKEIVLK